MIQSHAIPILIVIARRQPASNETPSAHTDQFACDELWPVQENEGKRACCVHLYGQLTKKKVP